MGPSSIDAEIRSLGPSAGGDVKLVEAFMLFLEYQLQSRRDFEFTEGVMGLFLKVYYILTHIQTLLLVSNFQAGGGGGGGSGGWGWERGVGVGVGVVKPNMKIFRP